MSNDSSVFSFPQKHPPILSPPLSHFLYVIVRPTHTRRAAVGEDNGPAAMALCMPLSPM